jgi:hypothetical protein
VSIQEAVTQLSSTPSTTAGAETPPVEIEIEDGELESEVDRVHSHGGHVRLHIRSDQLVVIDVEDHELSWSVPAGGETLIEFDAHSTKSFKLDLRRSKGVLVLRIRD